MEKVSIEKSSLALLLGTATRKRREALGLSQQDGAKMLGISFKYLQAIEVASFVLHSSKAKVFSLTFDWDKKATALIFHMISEIATTQIAGKYKKISKDEKAIRREWLDQYPYLTFLNPSQNSLVQLQEFLVIGDDAKNLQNNVAKFLKEHPEFIKTVQEFSNCFK